MTAELLAKQYDYTSQALESNLDGLTQKHSLFQPSPGGNCINWVAGHILYHRNAIHRLLELPAAWENKLTARYSRRSAPITTAEQAAQLTSIVKRLHLSSSLC